MWLFNLSFYVQDSIDSNEAAPDSCSRDVHPPAEVYEGAEPFPGEAWDQFNKTFFL